MSGATSLLVVGEWVADAQRACCSGSSPFVRLQLQLAPVVETCRRLVSTGQQSSEQLLELATDAFALAARLAFETRDDATAMALYTEATEVAGRSGDRQRRASVRTSHTVVTLHATGDLNVAAEIARAAVRDAHSGPSYAIRARAHAVHAEVCARAGENRQAQTALERALKTIDQLGIDDPYGSFNPDRLDGFSGLCALHTGDLRRGTPVDRDTGEGWPHDR